MFAENLYGQDQLNHGPEPLKGSQFLDRLLVALFKHF